MAATQLQEVFHAYDRDKNGRIDAIVLQAVLSREMKLNFSLSSVARLIRIHDPVGSGTIGFSQFLKLHAFVDNMQKSFKYFGAAKGELHRGEVKQALQHSGFELDSPAFEALFTAFDPDRNGSLGLAEYIALASYLRSASATFTAFDTQHAAKITLDFNQWIYASASCL